MLKDDLTIEIKSIMNDIKTNKSEPNAKLTEMCSVLLFVLDNIHNNPKLCDWISWHKNDKSFMNSVKEELSIVTEKTSIEVTSNLIDTYKDSILDHHFWNDADVKWTHKSTAYGNTPGEDVLIKLIALSLDKTTAGYVIPPKK